MRVMSEATRLTYRYDRLRAVSSGVIDSAASTFLILIAVQALHADSLSKSLIAAGGNIGLLLTLWLVPLAARLARPATSIASALLALGALGFVVAAAWPALPVYVAGSILAMACVNLVIPLVTFAYQANYSPRERGHYVSRALVIRVTVAAVAGEVGGRLLSADILLFRWLLAAFALALVFAAIAVRRMPSLPLAPMNDGKRHSPFHAMRFLKTDRTLRFTLVAWMLMGFANLMMVPLRVEYLANPRYGIQLAPQAIALYTIVVPSIVRILLTPMWGQLFDRMNFFAMRIILNVGFAVGTAAFFVGTSVVGLFAGAIVFGAAAAGGELAWSLWVTKFSPPEHVAEYMSIHTFFTGLRGIAAPILAFQIVESVSITTMGIISAIMIVLASLILVPEMRAAKPPPAG
jgi:MFS family permease